MMKGSDDWKDIFERFHSKQRDALLASLALLRKAELDESLAIKKRLEHSGKIDDGLLDAVGTNHHDAGLIVETIRDLLELVEDVCAIADRDETLSRKKVLIAKLIAHANAVTLNKLI